MRSTGGNVRRTTAMLTLAVSALAAASRAQAQGFDAARFVPAVGAASDWTLESPVVPYHLGLGFGLFLNVADDPVVERDTVTDDIVSRPIDHSLSADLVASIGLFKFAELGFHLPIHLIYDGDILGGTSVDGGIGDLRLVPKASLWGAGDADSHFVLGLAAPVSLPTGDDDDLRGAGGVVITPMITALAQFGSLGLATNLGYMARFESPPGLPWGDEIRLALSATYELAPSTLDVHGELFGGHQVGGDSDGPNLGLELLGAAIYKPSPAWRVFAGGAIGVSKGLGTPDFRVVVGVRFSNAVPERHGFADRDDDGIADRDDACETEAEDEDGYLDEDGCPEPDNDNDGIADSDDSCPELPDDDDDGDGCPSKTYVKIVDGKMVVFGKVLFETGSARVSRKSKPLLDQLAVAIKANPNVGVILIEGHTDDVGDDQVNKELSQSRADSVKEELGDRGVNEDRLRTKGFGETRPVAPNKTHAGRTKNRRVEFKILGKD